MKKDTLLIDERIGALIDKPTPKCPCCETHFIKRENLLGNKYFWVCPECSARYEIKEELK